MSEWKSEIRESDLQALEDKTSAGNYRKYLRRIVLKKVRGFTDRDVSLDFPVTALVGPNGGGKTTILGAAGLIYREVAPSRFFAKSGKYDASMKDWAIRRGGRGGRSRRGRDLKGRCLTFSEEIALGARGAIQTGATRFLPGQILALGTIADSIPLCVQA